MTSTLNCYNGTNSSEGIQLLKEYGEVTKTIDLSFVPSIEIDNVRIKNYFNSQLINFFRIFHMTKIGTCLKI